MAITVAFTGVPTVPIAQYANIDIFAVASGGIAPYVYSFTGVPPENLSINGATGEITGQIQVVGDMFVSVTATDSTLATGAGVFELNVIGLPSTAVRAPLTWKDDNCLKTGRQLARLIYDAVGTPVNSINPQGTSNQSLGGAVKSLYYNIKFIHCGGDTSGSEGNTIDIESQSNLMRVTLGVPADLLSSNAGFFDCIVSGALPFYCDEGVPITITYLPTGINPTSVQVRLFFANFDIPPFESVCVDNLTD